MRHPQPCHFPCFHSSLPQGALRSGTAAVSVIHETCTSPSPGRMQTQGSQSQFFWQDADWAASHLADNGELWKFCQWLSGGRDKLINLIGSLITSAIIFLIRDNYPPLPSCHMTCHFLLHVLMRYVIGALRRKRRYTASHEPQMNDHKHNTLALTVYTDIKISKYM